MLDSLYFNFHVGDSDSGGYGVEGEIFPMEADNFPLGGGLAEKVADSGVDGFFLVESEELGLEGGLLIFFIVFGIVDLGEGGGAAAHEIK